MSNSNLERSSDLVRASTNRVTEHRGRLRSIQISLALLSISLAMLAAAAWVMDDTPLDSRTIPLLITIIVSGILILVGLVFITFANTGNTARNYAIDDFLKEASRFESVEGVFNAKRNL